MAFEINVSSTDLRLERFANMMALLSAGEARRAMARALTHEGNKTRTQVRREVTRQMGISYAGVSRAITTQNANVNSLIYKLEGRGRPPNLGNFKARQGKRGVHASPWNRAQGPFRNAFGGSFMIGGRVFIRQSLGRKPIKPLYGPGIANEMVRDASLRELHDLTPRLQARIGHELTFMMLGGNRSGVRGGK